MAHEGNDRGGLTPLARDQFAVTQKYKYLNHAAAGVLPQPVKAALQKFVEDHAQAGILGTWPYERDMPQYRARVARFVGAQANEIAVLRNTSDGANVLAGGVRWQAGDEIVLPRNEFPANLLPWLKARKRGAAIRFVHERLTPDVLRATITPRTKVVTVSWVSYEDGYRHDLAALAEIAHDAGALFFVDAMQALGAFPVDVTAQGIDALYAGGAKWLLALQGVSFLYVRAGLIEEMELAAPGWRSPADMWDFGNLEQGYVQDATRFEGGTPNFIGALSLAESMAVIEAAGTSRIAAHVLKLTDHLVDGLLRMGAGVASIRSDSVSSGIVTFTLAGTDPIALGQALARNGIVTTYRANGVRVSPHGYNTTDEIDALLEVAAASRKEAQCSH